jgi:uncharacterized repeat protein (TIGR01451 family)
MGTGKVGNLWRARTHRRRTAVVSLIGMALVAGALLVPLTASAHDASDFFVFAKASFGDARKSNETDCDNSNDKQADVSGSGNTIHGRIHSNADIVATSGANNTFQGELTFGTHDEGCQEQSESNNTYNAGQPGDIDADPSNVTGGWPGDLNDYVVGGLTIDSIADALPGETCDNGTSLSGSSPIVLTAANNGQVICNGTGEVKLDVSGVTMSITILSHGPIVFSGQNNNISPAAHGILAFTDHELDVAIKLAGSNFTVPVNAILFAPRGGIDTSGSDDADMCIQLIGQGPIKVPGSNSVFGPGSAACTGAPPGISIDKTPDAQNVSVGQPISFTLEVTSNGAATAQNVVLTDNLPQDSGLDWSESPDNPNCSIAGALGAEVLTCNFGSLNSGDERSVTVSSPTGADDCGTYNNTGQVTATGGLSDSDNGQVTVQCNGSITIIKDTVPNADDDFSFTDNIPSCTIGTLDDNGSGSTPNQRTCSNVAPGQYTVTEGATSGFSLTNLVCSDANSTGDIPNRAATINLDSGESVTCTFTNSENGQIEIRKDAQPDSGQDFAFTDSIPGCDIGSLDDDSNGTLDNDTTCSNVAPGNYSVSENDPTSSGWALTGLTCSDANSVESVGTRTASIVLDPGEELLCTFVNTQPPGSITIVKDAVPNSGQDFAFTDNISGCNIGTLDDDGAGGSATSNQATCSNLTPNTYTVSENTLPSGWVLTNLVCSDGSTVNLGTRTASIGVGPGENVTCTFTNTQNGSITIVKDAVPNSAQDFAFTDSISGCNIGTLDDDGAGGSATPSQATCSNLTPGQYTVSENDPSASGFGLSNLVCGDDNSLEDIGTRTATVNLEPGESVTCTFTNTQAGKIVVVKQTNPDLDQTDFTFDTSYGADFVLKDGQQNDSGNLAASTYTVAELVPAGWALTGLSCVDPSGGTTTSGATATVALAAGETVTCTFTNTKAGKVIVKKVMQGGTDTFSFTGTPNGSIAANNGTISADVAPGLYASTEDAKAGWTLASISCDDVQQTPSSGNVGTRTANFNVSAGETVTCTFTNVEAPSSIVVTKTADPTTLPEPGGNVTFTVLVQNASPSDDVTLTAGGFTDAVEGGPAEAVSDIDCNGVTAGNGLPLVLQQNDNAAGGADEVTCTFVKAVTGAAGAVIDDVVEVTGTDEDGATVKDDDDASVTITDVPSSIVVTKTADPTTLPEPGGNVTFTVLVQNTSVTDDVTLTAAGFTDAVEGGPATVIANIDCNGGTAGNGLPLVLQQNDNAAGGSDEVTCTFVNAVTGAPGAVIDDVVEVTGTDDEGNPVKDDDPASVTITDVPSSIVVTKTADPISVPEPGGNVTFTVVVQNTSVTDDVSLTAASFTDSVEGGPAEAITDIDCNGGSAGNGLPIVLQQNDNAAGGTDEVTCTFVKPVTGTANQEIDDLVEVTGTDDDGNPVKDDDPATVTITPNPGTIVIEKQTIPNGDPETFGFTGEIVTTLGDGGTDSKPVAAGTYTVTETAEPGWVITSMGCSDANSTGSVDTGAFTYRVAPGETVTCTVENTKLGTIVVEKQTRPDGDPTEFAFSGDIDANVSDGDTASESVLPGDYSVAETVPAGWDLEEINCVDPTQNSEGVLGTATANFDVAAGETITCTFVNEKDSNIVIVKETLPNGSQQQFEFDASYYEGSFFLGDGDQDDSGDLDPGSYQVSEDVPTGWQIDDVDCGESSHQVEGSSVGIDLGAGETVICTFTNLELGSIIVEKQTNPNGAGGTFSFTGDAAGSIGDNGQIVESGLEPGTYTSTEGASPGFDLTGISCNDEGSSGNVGTRTATFDLDAGETITCTFTNTQIPTITGQGAISVSKTANPTSVKEPGGPVEFTVTIQNTGPIGVTINDVHDSVFGSLDDNDGGTGPFDVPINLAPGESVSKTFTRQVTGAGGQVHTNVVTATGTDAAGNAVSDSDDARVEITERTIDLVVVKTATSPTPLNGIVNYTMTVTNKGPDTATNVQLADPAPAGITYLTVSPAAPTCNLTPSLITCSLGNLAAGQTVTVNVTARATAIGTHTNVATVTGGGGRETNPADNVDDAVTLVPAPFVPPSRPEPKPKPKPQPPACLTLTVAPKMIKADGRPDRVSVKVTQGSKRVRGTKVTVFGAGVRKTGRSNANGMAFISINPKKAGLITITALETNQKVCGPKRIGVVGVFLPPLTG